jgi:K+-sensing histidine kinase KdpD
MTSAIAEPSVSQPQPWSPVLRDVVNLTSSEMHLTTGGAMGMLSAVAHDIREPGEIRDMVSAIHRRAMWLQGLVENLLCAATLREGVLRMRLETVEMPNLVLETLEMVEPLLAQKGQTASLRTRGPVADVQADSRRLSQVLTNLVLNASKFAEPDTAIQVSVTQRGPFVRVEVADRGPGLPVGPTDYLFEPFKRGVHDEGGSGTTEGVGLGLSIVKSVVQAHGGTVGATNRKGGGASFWFDVPVLSVASPVAGSTRIH